MSVPAWIRLLRPRHWLKNALVVVPLAAAHHFADASLVIRVLLVFAAFSLAASGQYVLNDILDLELDRTHPSKRLRPIAAGRVTLRQALALMFAAWAAALIIALNLGFDVAVIVIGYVIVMAAYSKWFKHCVLIDAIVLAAGYAARVAAGGAAVAIRPSGWLIAFCVCLFYSLALLKRFAEITSDHGQTSSSVAARGYVAGDLPILMTCGVASGYLAILVLALYLTAAGTVEHLYRRPAFIGCTGILLLYWTSYLWLLAHRGNMPDDPFVFATRDRRSMGLIAAMAACAWLAI